MPALATSPYSGFMFICHYNIVFISCTKETASVDTCAADWTYSFGRAFRDPNLCLSAVSSRWTGLSERALVRSHNLRTVTPCVRHTSINITWMTVVSCNRCKWSEVEWSYGEVVGGKLPCTLGWPYIEGTWLCCDYFIWCVSCTVVVLTCSVKCECVYIWGL